MAANVIQLVITDISDPASEINQGINGTLRGIAVVAGVLSPQGIAGQGGCENKLIVLGSQKEIAMLTADIVMHMENDHPGFCDKFMRMLEGNRQQWRDAVKG